MKIVLALACFMALATPAAHAIQRCTMPNGKVEYSDRGCAAAATSTRPNLVDSTTDGQRPAQPSYETQQQSRPYGAQVAQAQPDQDRVQSHDCQRAMKNHQTSASSKTYKPTYMPDSQIVKDCGLGAAQAMVPARPAPRPVNRVNVQINDYRR